KTPQEALNTLCAQQEKVMARIQRSGMQGDLGPKLNTIQDPKIWLASPGAPVAKLADERPKGETIAYDELLKSWQQ
ncbi:carbohydrate ABC transporter substrate-binding protein, partial [Luminiphilus sp.]|nr:carbohydrate ABC transporter substrate-binding protein [Luminiphilus sp.]